MRLHSVVLLIVRIVITVCLLALLVGLLLGVRPLGGGVAVGVGVPVLAVECLLLLSLGILKHGVSLGSIFLGFALVCFCLAAVITVITDEGIIVPRGLGRSVVITV